MATGRGQLPAGRHPLDRVHHVSRQPTLGEAVATNGHRPDMTAGPAQGLDRRDRDADQQVAEAKRLALEGAGQTALHGGQFLGSDPNLGDPLGFPVAEQFHPLFATDDAPSFSAFQQTPLQTFWPVVVGVIAVIEVFSVFTFENPASRDADGNPAQPWTIKKDHVAGDLGFDPLGLKPTDAAGLAEMQTKELNNGRLAMIAIAGMVVQEGITGCKLF